MKISLNTNQARINKNNFKQNKYINIKPLKADCVSFGNLKKTNFEGFDLYAIEKFKAPIEKFNSNDDFQNWCAQKLDEEYLSKIEEFSKSNDEQAEFQKKDILDQWVKYITVENQALTPAIQLLILSSITSNLSSKTNRLPVNLNKRVVADTLSEINDNLKKDKSYSFNFEKLYYKKLFAQAISNDKTMEGDFTGWVKIPSQINDWENFAQNVEKLKVLSHDSWCTKTYNAEPYLAKGDFYIYFDKSAPKLGVRFEEDLIEEIQGPKNNRKIPIKYLDVLNSKFNISDYSNNALDQVVQAEEIQEEIVRLFPDGIENYSAEEILTKFGINVKKDENGMLTLNYFGNPIVGVSYSDIGVSEDKLLKNVVEIEGSAYFDESKVSSLKNLKRIGGDAHFSDYSTDIDLNNLESIGGNAYFEYSGITKLPKLKSIGNAAYFTKSCITDLSNLKNIGNDARFQGVKLSKSYKNLSVGKDLYIDSVKSLTKFKKVGGAIHTKDKIYSGEIVDYIRKAAKILNRNFSLREIEFMVKNMLTDKQIECYKKYTDEGIEPEEAAYEASFSYTEE